MIQTQPSKPTATFLTAVVAIVAALVFAWLWLQERSRIPVEVVRQVPTRVEVIKEVPVEKIREIPKEVVKEVEVIKEVEVPAKLTEAQQAAIDLSARFLSAPVLSDDDDALYKLDSIRVKVHLNEAVKKVISEERVKNKFELILRKHNIRLDEKAPVWLELVYEGLWNKEEIQLTYAPQMRLQQWATISRKGDLRRTIATVWQRGAYGYAGSKVAEAALISDVEEKAEAFANKYLAIQDKIK